MALKPAPSYANIYLAKKTVPEVKRLGVKYCENKTSAFILLKQFLDDLFLIFKGTTTQLHDFLKDLNIIHPTLKFTMQHTTPSSEIEADGCECETRTSIPFLKTSCSREEGFIDTDLYRKHSDRNQFLLPGSCHPNITTRSIPFILGLWIVRICSKAKNRDLRLLELKLLLLDRGYSNNMIESALLKARAVPRKQALLKRKYKQTSSRPVFAVQFDPRLLAIQSIQAKHCTIGKQWN